MSKTRQYLKTLNGGNLDTVQEFWDSSGILGQDSVKNFFKILNLGGNLFQFTRKYKYMKINKSRGIFLDFFIYYNLVFPIRAELFQSI